MAIVRWSGGGGGNTTPTPTPSNTFTKKSGNTFKKKEGNTFRKKTTGGSRNTFEKKLNSFIKKQGGAFSGINPTAQEFIAPELMSGSEMRNPYAQYTVERNQGNPFSMFTIMPNMVDIGGQKPVTWAGMGDLRRVEGGQQPIRYSDMFAGSGTEQGTLGEFLAFDRMDTESLLNSLYGLDEEENNPVYYGGGYGFGGGYGGRSNKSPYDFFFNLLNWRI